MDAIGLSHVRLDRVTNASDKKTGSASGPESIRGDAVSGRARGRFDHVVHAFLWIHVCPPGHGFAARVAPGGSRAFVVQPVVRQERSSPISEKTTEMNRRSEASFGKSVAPRVRSRHCSTGGRFGADVGDANQANGLLEFRGDCTVARRALQGLR